MRAPAPYYMKNIPKTGGGKVTTGYYNPNTPDQALAINISPKKPEQV
jgi:hypothetical protein